MGSPQPRKIINSLRLLYLGWLAIGMFSLMYVPMMIYDMDAMVLATNVEEQMLLFRFGILGRLFTQLMFIVIVWYLYLLFEPQHKPATYLMMIFTLVSVPIAMYNEMNMIDALGYLEHPEELQRLIRLHSKGVTLVSLFWGLWLFPLGYLVYHSPYFRKFIGIALYVGGLGYFLGTCIKLVWPDVTTVHTVFETLTLGEMVWVLWLIIVGGKKQAHISVA